MFTFIAIMLIILGIIMLALAIYSGYCYIGTCIFYKNIKKNGKEELEKKSRFNILVWFIKRLKKVKNASDDNIQHVVKFKVIIALCIAAAVFVHSMYGAFVSISIGTVVINMDAQVNTITGALRTVFGKDEDCKCYALCTGNKEDDEKSVYELLFGPTAYDKLANDMKKTAPYEVQEQFDKLNEGTDGKAKSDLLREHINVDMVKDYQGIVGSNSKFRSDDGLDRSQMSYDELKTDLYNLLCDYKVNGRNPNCECNTAAKAVLKSKCMGEAHYKEGWEWDAIWDSDDDGGNKTASNVPGTASGQYAVTLDDGSFYWYHQSREECSYNAKDDTFGYVGLLHAGGSGYGTMSKRGCGIYSTAMALSNILGEEITPWKVITDVMKCSIKGGTDGAFYFESTSSNGIAYSCSSPSYSFSGMANLINAAYGSQGVVAKEVNFDEGSLNAYFDDSSKYTYVINSYDNPGFGDSAFTWYGGGGHFMVLRKTDDGKYKCFTSATTKYGGTDTGIAKGMNDAVSWSTVAKHNRHATCLVISRDKSYYSTGEESGGGEGGDGTLVGGTVLDFTSGGNFACPYSNSPTYMGWQMIGVPGSSAQAEFITSHFSDWGKTGGKSGKNNPGSSSAFDAEGFGRVDGRYVVATTHRDDGGIAAVGEKLDAYLENGEVIRCIVGDIKDSGDKTWTKWGHTDGKSVSTLEFIVNRNNPSTVKWYNNNSCTHVNPGTSRCHPEWGAKIVKIMVGGTESTSGGNSGGGGNSSGGSSGGTSQETDKRTELVNYAKSFVGSHYVYGGNTMGCKNWSDSVGIDCSGFVHEVYKHFGYEVARNSSSLRTAGQAVKSTNVSDMLPGDIVCYSGHVAIYIGNGQIVHASSAKTGVKISNNVSYRTILAVRRVIE